MGCRLIGRPTDSGSVSSGSSPDTLAKIAQVEELVDSPASGAGGRYTVGVQVLLTAPMTNK
jgi:hypothetical protein